MSDEFKESWGKVAKVNGMKHDLISKDPKAEMFFFKIEQGQNEYWETYVVVNERDNAFTWEEARSKCQKIGEGLSVLGWKGGKLASLTKMKDINYFNGPKRYS